jgi:hypothetical protein
MTMAMAFIGKGEIGEVLVILASLLHLVLVVWFIYMSLAYQTMPGGCIIAFAVIFSLSYVSHFMVHFNNTIRSKLVSEYHWNWFVRCQSMVLLSAIRSLPYSNHPNADITLFSDQLNPRGV